MPLVHIKSPELSSEQKKRIGERIISAFHAEGMPSGSVVVLFERELADLFLEGGLLFEVSVPAIPVPPAAPWPPVAPVEPVQVVAALAGPADGFKSKVRRSRSELADLKEQLVAALQGKGVLSSFQAQIDLGLKQCDWAPATLRRFFAELEDEGVIGKQGQKRGTRYVWKGMATQPVPALVGPKLVKHPETELEF